MIGVVGRAQQSIDAARERGTATLRTARGRYRWFDHLARAYERYQDRRGDRLAAAMTYFGFLSFFPLVALAYALLGYLVAVSERARDYLVKAIGSVLPGLSEQLPVQQVAQAKAAAGIIGLVGLLIVGLGWVAALRESLRVIWGNDPGGGGNFLVKKAMDIGLLVFLGATLIASVAMSTVATGATHEVLEQLGLAGVLGMGTMLWMLSLGVAVVFDTVIFLVMFSRLSGTQAPWQHLLRGALFGAVGFELLKLIATLLIGTTMRNPVYASFAVVAGLLVWIDAVSRFVLFAAAWTATRSVVMDVDGAAPEPARTRESGRTEPSAPAAAARGFIPRDLAVTSRVRRKITRR
jgi:inner membrane protein YhjD